MSVTPRAGLLRLVLLLVLAALCLSLTACEGVVIDDGGGGAGGAGGQASKPKSRSASSEAEAREAERYGGKINYGKVDPTTGQRSGITATITPGMVRAAEKDELGSPAKSSIRPPGFDKLPSRNRARGHLLGRQLGGSGDLAANLVALYQRAANSPVMRDYETMVANAVEDGETIDYEVTPVYDGPTDKGAPRAIRIKAKGDHGFRLDVQIANTVKATVKEYVSPPG
jgi:hypothetical protein